MTERLQKITFGDMRDSGVRGLLIYCADYHCSHSISISGDCRPDELRLTCHAATVCQPRSVLELLRLRSPDGPPFALKSGRPCQQLPFPVHNRFRWLKHRFGGWHIRSRMDQSVRQDRAKR